MQIIRDDDRRSIEFSQRFLKRFILYNNVSQLVKCQFPRLCVRFNEFSWEISRRKYFRIELETFQQVLVCITIREIKYI